jgi:hypothetical protein
MTKNKDMTDEEKLQKKRDYHREYMKNRRENDEVFANKEKERNNAYKKYLYKNDLNFKEKTQTYNRERARENVSYKAKYEELLEKMNLKDSEK